MGGEGGWGGREGGREIYFKATKEGSGAYLQDSWDQDVPPSFLPLCRYLPLYFDVTDLSTMASLTFLL